MRVFLLPEPELFFGDNGKCIDPQVGLFNYGPHGGFRADRRKISITSGIIGTDRSINATRLWLQRLKYRIAAKETSNTEYKGIDFPGLDKDGPLGFEIQIDDNCVVKISNRFINSLDSISSRRDRIKLAAREYSAYFDDLKEAHPAPQIILLPIDIELMNLCKEPNRKNEKIVYQKRSFGDPDTVGTEFFDFHNYLKAQAALRGLVTQMITPMTLTFADQKQSAALIGWNVSVGIYYKATGTPWKLADIDDETCYIGISFYNDINEYNKTIRASIAQVYMRTGESQVIRGRPFDWNEVKYGRNVHLEASDMMNLISDSIELFRRQRGRLPKRVVVHKSTKFSEDEISGCASSCERIDELDIINVSEYTRFRAYPVGGDYPVVRGTVLSNNNEAMLFTTGFIPALGTYPGSSVPRPLHISCQRLDTSIETVCNDILGLTKLDWNSSTFCMRMPVTIGVSRKVGSVMAEMVAGTDNPPASYKYYM